MFPKQLINLLYFKLFYKTDKLLIFRENTVLTIRIRAEPEVSEDLHNFCHEKLRSKKSSSKLILLLKN
jgi:hypothetical protein